MTGSRYAMPLVAGLGAAVVGGLLGCEPRRSYYQEPYEENRVITPAGVGDDMAVYRTSGANTAPTTATVTTTSAAPMTPIRDTTVATESTTTTVRREPSVVVVDRAAASPLRVEVVTPGTALICEDIPVRFLVTNTSGVDAPDAWVQATLPPGLRTVKGDTTVSMNVGLVPANGTREITVPVRAERAGSFLSLASVSQDPNSRSSVVETAMVVGQPVLNLTLEATEPSADANVVVVKVRVSNTGNVEARDTVVTATMSPNTRAVDRGTATQNMDRLIWNFGVVAPGEAKEATVRLDASSPGVVTGNASATARCAEPAAASFDKVVR